jgi:hypothetical protein
LLGQGQRRKAAQTKKAEADVHEGKLEIEMHSQFRGAIIGGLDAVQAFYANDSQLRLLQWP